MACRQMYYGDSYVESDLCNSYAWDTAIVYIQAMGNSNYANAGRGSNTSLLNTGETGDEKCKIFDMAANMDEWTTEYSTYVNNSANVAVPNTYRGSCYGYENKTAITRSYSTKSSSSTIDTNFRVTLYIKSNPES